MIKMVLNSLYRTKTELKFLHFRRWSFLLLRHVPQEEWQFLNWFLFLYGPMVEKRYEHLLQSVESKKWILKMMTFASILLPLRLNPFPFLPCTPQSSSSILSASSAIFPISLFLFFSHSPLSKVVAHVIHSMNTSVDDLQVTTSAAYQLQLMFIEVAYHISCNQYPKKIEDVSTQTNLFQR